MHNSYRTISSLKQNRFDKYLILLILSLGMGNIGSPLLLSRVLAVVFLPSLFIRLGNCNYTKPIRQFFIFLIVFCVCSLAWTFNFTEGCKAIVYNILHFALFSEIIVFSRYANNPLRSISQGWMFVVLLLSVISIWEITTGNHLSIAYEDTQSINVDGVISTRMIANGTFANYNGFVTFLCFALPWIFYHMSITFKEKLIYILSVVTLLLAILTVFIDGSRGGLFAVITVVTVYIFFKPKGKASYVTFVLFIGALIFMIFQYGEQIFFVLSVKGDRQGLTSDSSRIEIWSACLKALVRTFGLGSGIGGVSGAIESVSKSVINVPHNMILEAFLEYGLIIGITFIVFIGKLLKRGYKLIDRNRRMAVMMAILSMPFYCIINSLYLKGPETFALFATIFVFVNYERIRPVCK